MIIRALEPRDMPSVMQLMKHNMLRYYQQRREVWNDAALTRFFMAQKGIVLLSDQVMAGFSFYNLTPSELHIHTLQVQPSYQGRTSGKQLFQWLVTSAADLQLKAITCSVYDSNPAYKMYVRMGFKEVGRSEGVVRLILTI